jgi:ribosomal protein L13
MLPKTTLSRTVLRLKLRVYPNAEHPHQAQKPEPLNLKRARAS